MSQVPDETSSANQGLFLVQVGRARKHLREGRLGQARQELEAAQIVRPNDEDVLNLISVIEFKLGRYEDAARAARRLVSENPTSAVLHANLGLILFKAGSLPDAEQELRRAIELKPDHARSHLYLGLLYRTRGKLGLALEHLRFAGAKRLVTEIEDLLRRSLREGAAKAAPVEPNLRLVPPAAEAAPEAPAEAEPDSEPESEPAFVMPFTEELAAASIIRPAEREPTFAEAMEGKLAPPPPVVTMAREGRERMRRSEDGNPRITAAAVPAETRPLFQVRSDGGLEVASREAVFLRKGSVVWYSGKIRFLREPAFQAMRLERILRAEGRGSFFLSDPGKSAYRRELGGYSLHVEASRLLALDTALTFRLDPIHDLRNDRRVDILKVHGHGSVILSIGGSLLGHDVSLDFPLIVAARDLVAWSGNLAPSVVEDRFLEEVMAPDPVGAPKIRFEGEGLVLTEPPRARRYRSSDVNRTTEADRRT
ncbi:MAG: tetratricopeptide repeat protein [Thermoanaerobaculia bacterium]